MIEMRRMLHAIYEALFAPCTGLLGGHDDDIAMYRTIDGKIYWDDCAECRRCGRRTYWLHNP